MLEFVFVRIISVCALLICICFEVIVVFPVPLFSRYRVHFFGTSKAVFVVPNILVSKIVQYFHDFDETHIHTHKTNAKGAKAPIGAEHSALIGVEVFACDCVSVLQHAYTVIISRLVRLQFNRFFCSVFPSFIFIYPHLITIL